MWWGRRLYKTAPTLPRTTLRFPECHFSKKLQPFRVNYELPPGPLSDRTTTPRDQRDSKRFRESEPRSPPEILDAGVPSTHPPGLGTQEPK